MSGAPHVTDVLIAIALSAACVLALIPGFVCLLAKTQERALRTSPEGIETSIGTQSARIPWTEITSVAAHAGFLVLTRQNGNSFVIPDRAFASAEERRAFQREVERYRGRSAPQASTGA